MKLPKFRKKASKDLAKSEAQKGEVKIPKPSKEKFSKEEEKKAKEILKEEADTQTQEVELTVEQIPTIIKDGKGTTILTLKTTTEKLLYQIIQQQDTIIQQNNHMIGLSEKE